MRTLYFDCFAGIAGDMTVAALLELGVPLSLLRERLALLPLDPGQYHIGLTPVSRKGVTGSLFTVDVADQHHHRHYTDIVRMIERSSLPPGARERALLIFRRLADAEAKVHGVPLEKVHFHEVGAVDSIVDIVGTAICLDYLEVAGVHASPLPYGSGHVQTAHGRLPVPAPATAELLRGMPVHFDIGPGERVTPTGAAIVAALAGGFGAPPPMRVTAIGCGAGSKDFDDVPNILRVVLGEQVAVPPRDTVRVIETHLDDMNPEILGFLMERLLEQGALDVAFSPLQMKKNRPGVKLTVLCAAADLEQLARLLLVESTAAGVRHYAADRLVLDRAQEERETSLGRLLVKVFREGGRTVRVVPEFEECRRIAEAKSMPLIEVYRTVEREVTQS